MPRPLKAPKGAPEEWLHPDGFILWRPGDPVEASSHDMLGRVWAKRTGRDKEIKPQQVFVRDGTVGKLAATPETDELYVRVPVESIADLGNNIKILPNIESVVLVFDRADWAPLKGNWARQRFGFEQETTQVQFAHISVMDHWGELSPLARVEPELYDWLADEGGLRLVRFGRSLYITPFDEISELQARSLYGAIDQNKDISRVFMQPWEAKTEEWVELEPFGLGTLWQYGQINHA